MSGADLDPVALAFWRAREMALPARARRMTPDALDFASGAWAWCVAQAHASHGHGDPDRRSSPRTSGVGNEPSAQDQAKPNVLNNNTFPRSLRP